MLDNLPDLLIWTVVIALALAALLSFLVAFRNIGNAIEKDLAATAEEKRKRMMVRSVTKE